MDNGVSPPPVGYNNENNSRTPPPHPNSNPSGVTGVK